MYANRFLLKDNKGFTIMEGIISISLFVIAAIGTYSALILAQEYVVRSRQMTQAMNFTSSKLEEITDIEFTEITDTYPPNQTYELSDNYTPYLPSARWKVQYFNEYGSQSTSADPLIIKVTLYWKKTDNTDHSIQLSTKITTGAI